MRSSQPTPRRGAITNRLLGFGIVIAVLSLSTASHALRGGVVILGFPGVVEFNGCTGSMIAPHVVLTAAHCFDAMGATMSSRGTGNFMVFYHDPKMGRRPVFSGTATWIVSASYRGFLDANSSAGNANADHGLLVITPSVSAAARFTDTDHRDYLRIYSDRKELLNTNLHAYGAGSHSYSGNSDNQLRTQWLEVENVDYNHIVVDTRDDVSLCKGDSGGPLIYNASASGVGIPAIAGVLSGGDTVPDEEGDNCAHNDPPHDDAFYSRISWEVIRFIEEQTGVSCRVQSGADVEYVRCFDLPFIDGVEYEGLPRDLAVGIAASALD